MCGIHMWYVFIRMSIIVHHYFCSSSCENNWYKSVKYIEYHPIHFRVENTSKYFLSTIRRWSTWEINCWRERKGKLFLNYPLLSTFCVFMCLCVYLGYLIGEKFVGENWRNFSLTNIFPRRIFFPIDLFYVRTNVAILRPSPFSPLHPRSK